MRNYIFDLDGTLIDSSEEILSCIKKAYIMADCKSDFNKINSSLIGLPIMQIIEKLTPDLKNQKISNEIMENFRSIYDNNEFHKTKLYEGVYETLCYLKTKNKKLFIATYKPNKPTMKILKKFHLNMFDDRDTVDKFHTQMKKAEMVTNIINKYNLNKETTALVGDTISDIDAACQSGIYSIGVSWGFEQDKSSLIKNADYIINNFKELKDFKYKTKLI